MFKPSLGNSVTQRDPVHLSQSRTKDPAPTTYRRGVFLAQDFIHGQQALRQKQRGWRA